VREAVASTLINIGFEAEEPQLIIPLKLAESLELTSAEASIEDFGTGGGGRVSGYRVEEPIEVELVLGGEASVKATARVTILPGETEAIMSDRLASELGIIIPDLWRGYWCLKDELGAGQRPSVPPQEWR
ncbi:MAG: hypothetical protein QXE79_06480, partial [Candidatus Bathyarchaeia archaeon]